MTDKRFHYHIDEVGIYYYICDGGKTEDKIFAEVIGDVEEVTDKLNELHEENMQLKQQNKTLSKELIYEKTHRELHELIIQELNSEGNITLEKYEEYLNENYKKAKRDYLSQKLFGD